MLGVPYFRSGLIIVKRIKSFLTAFETVGDIIDETEATLSKSFQPELERTLTTASCKATALSSKNDKRQRMRRSHPLERMFLLNAALQSEVKEALRALAEADFGSDVSTIILCPGKLPTTVLEFAHDKSYIPLEEPGGVSQANVETVGENTAGARNQNDNLGTTGSFPGHVTLRDRYSATAFALNEHKSSRRDTNRMVFWVDGSVSDGTSFSGMGVTFKQSCDGLSLTWSVKSYKVHEERVAPQASFVLEAEMWAIRQGLQVAQERISHGDFSTRAPAASPMTVAIYSDCRPPLTMIRDLRLGGQSCGAPILEGIIAQANALIAIGVQVYLHWAPGHAGIPGNVLADRSAKRATKNNNLRRNNFLEIDDRRCDTELED